MFTVPLLESQFLICSFLWEKQSINLFIIYFKVNTLLVIWVKVSTFQFSTDVYFPRFIRVGTAANDTVPTTFISFMSINKYICCHKSQTTKYCGNGAKLKTLRNKLQTTIWHVKGHRRETFQYSDAIFLPSF